MPKVLVQDDPPPTAEATDRSSRESWFRVCRLGRRAERLARARQAVKPAS